MTAGPYDTHSLAGIERKVLGFIKGAPRLPDGPRTKAVQRRPHRNCEHCGCYLGACQCPDGDVIKVCDAQRLAKASKRLGFAWAMFLVAGLELLHLLAGWVLG